MYWAGEGSAMTALWRVQFYERVEPEAVAGRVPAREFLDGLTVPIVAEIQAVLDLVAAGPPPSFPHNRRWQEMQGELAGIYVVRVHGNGLNHRLYCLLEPIGALLGGPSIVCLAGVSKPRHTPTPAWDHTRVLRYRKDFSLYHRVST